MQNNKDCNKHGIVLDVSPKDFDKGCKSIGQLYQDIGQNK